MENEIVKADATETVQRDLGVITNDIQYYWRIGQQTTLMCIIEIGRRLCEAKDLVKHGEWGEWIKQNFEFSQQSANRFMQLFQEYGGISNSSPVRNLPYSKALQLLAIPSEEREEFVKEVGAEDLSRSELQNAIEGRKAAEQIAKDAVEREQELSQKLASAEIAKAKAECRVKEFDQIREKVEKLEADLKKRKESEAKLKEKLKAAEKNPKIPEELLAKINEEVEAKVKATQDADIQKRIEDARADAVADIAVLQKELEGAKASLDAAYQKRLEAEASAKDAMDKLKEARIKLKMANPKVTAFDTLFKEFQAIYGKLQEMIADISEESPEIAKGLSGAIKSFGDMMIKK